MDMNERKAFYVSQIQDNFLPYWLKFVDREQGGILNCIHNNGDQRLSDNKFTWSQGRWLWVLARVYRLDVYKRQAHLLLLIILIFNV